MINCRVKVLVMNIRRVYTIIDTSLPELIGNSFISYLSSKESIRLLFYLLLVLYLYYSMQVNSCAKIYYRKPVNVNNVYYSAMYM